MAKVQSITITNLKAISTITADFKGCTALITGRNNSGKSTLIDILPNRIRGIRPDVVLKFGESDGQAVLELTTGDKFVWDVTTKTKAGEKLTFITKDNIKTSVTKELAARFFPPVFDVDKFLTDGPKKQNESLQKLVGLDFTAINARHKSAYDDRTYANRKQQEETAKVVQVDLSLPETEDPTDDLQKELMGIDAHNQRYEYVRKGVQEKTDQEKECDTQIAALKKQILELEKRAVALHDEVTKGEDWMAVEGNKPKPDTHRTDLETRIRATTDRNERIRKNNAAREQVQKLADANKVAEDADNKVKAIEQERLDMIKGAKLPEGFGFTDDGITYNGLPFTREQLSSSGIYIAALKLAALTLGEVKMLHFDASFLDKNSLAEIEQWATDNDLQLLIERPDYEGGEIKYELINPA